MSPVWGMARGQGHSGTHVGHREGLGAQWDLCGARGWAEGTVGPVWGMGRAGQSKLSVGRSEG